MDLPGYAGGPSQANAVAVDPLGDVVVCGAATGAVGNGEFLVVKLSGAGGGTIWSRPLASAGVPGECDSLAIDSTGDVLVGGVASLPNGARSVTVAKLERQTGDVTWRHDQFAAEGNGARLAIDGAGDVFAGATFATPTTHLLLSTATAFKLAGATGAPVWFKDLDGTDPPTQGALSALALGASGDPIAGTSYLDPSESPPTGGAHLWRLAAATGDSLPLPRIFPGLSPGFSPAPTAVRTDGSGTVFVSGALGATSTAFASDSDLAVARTDEATGTTGWVRAIDGPAHGVDRANDVVGLLTDGTGGKAAALRLAAADGAELWRYAATPGEAQAVLADPAGDLFLTGALRDAADTRTGFAVAKIAASDGSELWRSVLDGAATPDGARGVALARRSDAVVAAGWTGPTAGRKLTVVTLDPATGASLPVVPPSCVSGIAITSAALSVKHSGNGQTADATITANLPFPAGRPVTFDPQRQGLQVRVEDVGSGLAAVLDASDASQPVPSGAVGEGCDPRHDGWTAKRGVFRYQNTSRAVGVPGCTPGSARGVRTVVLHDRRAQGRGIDLRFVSKGAPPFGALVGPLRLTMILGTSTDAALAGDCGVISFGASACKLAGVAMHCR